MSAHWPFVIAAYAAAGVIVALMILWVILDHRALSRRLAGLEAQGARRARRSA